MDGLNNFRCTSCDVCGDEKTSLKLSSQLTFTRELDDEVVVDDLNWCVCEDCLPMIGNEDG
ncbi:MAG: hypothetical protein APF84_08925 [Gracilibacter sp. BRH_c7a]|nr:MAG: hypothetical protein APF84_08925 [Gracilibacter sp. BRH_c7a]